MFTNKDAYIPECGGTCNEKKNMSGEYFKTPSAVYSKTVHPDTTYDQVLTWWHSEDNIAKSARDAVLSGAVCFVQLGGSSSVLVCVPSGQCTVQSCSKPRGTPGTATLLSYAPA